MKTLHLSLLYLLSLLVLLGVAIFQHSPGYMDADYYLAGGMSIASGDWQEPFIWNYLDGPAGLPHPAFAYWMPLASLLAAGGMLAGGSLSFAAGRAGFIILAALVSPLTAVFAYRLHPDHRAALLAGLLAVCAGFYLPYLPTTDTFGLVMLLGGVFLLLGQELSERGTEGHSPWRELAIASALGVLAGLMHLGRADGLLWLGIGGLAVLGWPLSTWRRSWPRGAALILGYLLVMAPWMARNLTVFGSLLSAAGLRPLWITTYDELFAYPASLLTPQHWLAAGFPALLGTWLKALTVNLQSLLAVQGQIFLLPLMLVGLWRLRRKQAVRLGILTWILVIGVMTLVFPHQGWRGGYFHSAAALQPLLWAVTPLGLDTLLHWAAEKRGWNLDQARRVFQAGLLLLAAGFSLVLLAGRVLGANSQPGWDAPMERYTRLGAGLEAQGIPLAAPLLVNNPPGFTLAAGRPAVAVPDGPPENLLAAARRYGACWVLLEPDHPDGLAELYAGSATISGLELVTKIEDTHLYQVSACMPNLQDMSPAGVP